MFQDEYELILKRVTKKAARAAFLGLKLSNLRFFSVSRAPAWASNLLSTKQ